MLPFKSEHIPSEFMNISSVKVTAQWKRNYCNSGKHWSHERGSLAARRCSFQIWLPTMKQKREQLSPNDTNNGTELLQTVVLQNTVSFSHNCQKYSFAVFAWISPSKKHQIYRCNQSDRIKWLCMTFKTDHYTNWRSHWQLRGISIICSIAFVHVQKITIIFKASLGVVFLSSTGYLFFMSAGQIR